MLFAHDGLAAVSPRGTSLGQFGSVLFAGPKGFFESEPAGDQKLRKGRRVGFDAFGFRQFLRQFRDGDVIAGRHSNKNKVPVGRELAMRCFVMGLLSENPAGRSIPHPGRS